MKCFYVSILKSAFFNNHVKYIKLLLLQKIIVIIIK